MKHYPHHIGDFDRATRHLTRIERSVYRDMIEMYYDIEKALPLDVAWIRRKVLAHTNEESTAVEQALNEFFIETPEGWWHERCEEELDKYRANNSQRAQAGKASAAKRAASKQLAINSRSTSVATSDQRADNDAPTNQSTNQPINQEPIQVSDDTSSSDAPPTIPACPHAKVISLFASRLPELPKPKVEFWQGAPADALRARWKFLLTASRSDKTRYATNEAEALDWFDRFFEHVSDSDWLMGRTGNFKCTLQWLVKAENFAKTVQGNYENKTP